MSDLDRIPPLRAGLAIEPQPDGSFRLADPALGRRLKLDARGAEIARLLDRPQTPLELLDRVATGGRPMAPEALVRVIRAFEALGLLGDDTEQEAIRDHRAMTDRFREDRQNLPLLIPEDLRFTCTACGSCCTGVNIPVDHDTIESLQGERMEVMTRATRSKKGLLYSMVPETGGAPTTHCHSFNGGCIFREDDRLCGLHRRWGLAAKPQVCRLFPYQFLLTPQGVVVGLQMECRDILRASQGAPVREDEAGIRALLDLAKVLPEARSHVALDHGAALGFEAYEALEARVVAAVDAAGSGFDRLIAAGNEIRTACRDAGAEVPAPREDLAEIRAHLWGLVGSLGTVLARKPAQQQVEGTNVVFHSDNLDLFLEALAELPLQAHDALAPAETGDAARFAGLALRNFWRSKAALFPQDVLTAQSFIAFQWLMTRATALVRTRQSQRSFLEAQDLVDAWVAVHMLMRNHRVLAALSPFRDDFVRLFVHDLPSLVAMRHDLREADDRMEIWVF